MKKITTLLLIGILSGCSTQSYNINGGAGNEPTKEKMQAFFVSGLGQTQEMDAAKICGGVEKVAKVESHMSFLNGFIGTITFGIYTPRQAKVYCKK
jgi:hypothetical protein